MIDLGNNPDEDIFVRTQQYLQGEITPAQLYEWVTPWIKHFLFTERETTASDLAATFLLGTYELGDGLNTEEAIKEELRSKFFADNPPQNKER